MKQASLVTAGFGLLYSLYRAYYGFGGTVGMVGTVSSQREWQTINLAGAAILLLVAALPIAILPLWGRRRARRILLGLCWVLAVGFVMHAVIDDIQRVLSLAGVIRIDYPALWATIDRREADIQDLVFNETWFLLEGILWGVIAWIALDSSRGRRWWTVTALIAVAAMTTVGMLSTFGVVGKVVIF